MKRYTMLVFWACCMFGLLISVEVSAQNLPRNYEKKNFFDSMEQANKAALLIVHFGSAYADAHEKVLDVMTLDAETVFSNQLTVREAYAARSIVKRLAEQGIVKYTPAEALSQLRNEGFTHIIIQPTVVIEGVEMEAVGREAELAEAQFKEVRVGNPLLYNDNDYLKIINFFAHSELAKNEGAKLFAAHGTYTAANASFSQLGYMCAMLGHTDFYRVTIEKIPTIENLATVFKQKDYKHITLIPCMFVFINSEYNEVSNFGKKQLQELGFDATIYLKGLGEHPEIRQIIINHIYYAIDYKRISTMERKKII